MPEAETKEPKHTPLPWQLVLRDRTPPEIVAVGEAAPVVNWPGFDNADREKDAHEANAALIVRSVNSLPALVAAAEAAVKVIYRATPMVDGDDETIDKVVRDLADDMDAVRNQLTAAIAAAKGE